jgi:hypothetical protein
VRANDGRTVRVGRARDGVRARWASWVQAIAGEWSRRRCGDRAVTIVTSSSPPPRCRCERDSVQGRAVRGDASGGKRTKANDRRARACMSGVQAIAGGAGGGRRACAHVGVWRHVRMARMPVRPREAPGRGLEKSIFRIRGRKVVTHKGLLGLYWYR